MSEKPFSERSSYPLYLYEASSANLRRQVVVKFAPVFPENNEGQTEFENLTRVWREKPDDPNLGFIRPLDFIEDTNALVTEYVHSERFSPWFMRAASYGAAPAQQAELERRVRHAGRWLATFHRIADAGTSPASSCFCEGAERVAQSLERANLLQSAVREFRALLRRVAGRIADMSLRRALIHGDFGPQNMAFSGAKLYVFDLQRNFSEPIYHDIGYFLVTLDTLNPFPRYLRYCQRRARSLARPFLEGYFGSEPDIHDRTALRLFYLRNLLQRAGKQYQNLKRRGLTPSVARLVVAARYREQLRREMRTIESTL